MATTVRRVSHPSPWPALDEPPAALLVVTRHVVSREDRTDFLGRAHEAIGVLGEQAGFVCGSLAQSTDDANLFVIRTEWAGVGAYRRALSSFDVKMRAIPLLSSAVDEASAFEVVHHWSAEGQTSARSGLASDAGEVGLGHASAAIVPPVTTEAP